MADSTIGSNGRITIPKPVRDKLRLGTGDKVEFVLREDGTALMVPVTQRVRDLEGILPKPDRPVSLRDMDRAIRRRAASS